MKIVNKKIEDGFMLDIVRKYYDETPQIERFYSESACVVRLKFENFTKIMKINISSDQWKLKKEVYIFEILKTKNIPVPRIYFSSFDSDIEYYIMDDLGKYTLIDMFKDDSRTSKKLYEKMGEYFAIIHSIEFDKQGLISSDGIKEGSFYEFNQSIFDVYLEKLIEKNVLSIQEVQKCKDLFESFKDSKESVLCHNDFGPWQVIINDDKDKITGIIDWEWASSGCSVADFVKCETLMSIFGGELDDFRRGYGRIKSLPKDYNEIRIAYKIPHLLNILSHFKDEDDEFNLKKCKEYLDKLLFGAT